ncbi:MAG: TetR/AcrR family transcriptional regulator [Gracilibacteraceae bacterium]|jgi:AcrR family transcriptional regulator|nr:TetR/AcrR family transcriptional regulator [Gracilibacteraceae bacterium]
MPENEQGPPAWRELLTEAAAGGGTKKQAAVLIAAAELFSQKGYAATTTREIARAAGVSEGAVFKYFATKEALFERLSALLAEKVLFSLFGYGLEKIMTEHANAPWELFKALLRNRFELIENNLTPIRFLLQELPYRPELREKFLKILQEAPFFQAADAWKGQGLLCDLPVHALRRIMISCIGGFILSRVLVLPYASAEDREADIDIFVDFMARGLAPQGAAVSHEGKGEEGV